MCCWLAVGSLSPFFSRHPHAADLISPSLPLRTSSQPTTTTTRQRKKIMFGFHVLSNHGLSEGSDKKVDVCEAETLSLTVDTLYTVVFLVLPGKRE